MGKYELRPAVKKLYQLRPQVSASCVSVASRAVNPNHDELRPAVSKELYQFHRKRWVYVQNAQQLEGALLSVIVLYCIHNYMHTYGIVE